MNKIRVLQFFLLTSILYQLLIIVWVQQNKITFGVGLGGLPYYFLAIFSASVSAILLIASFFVNRIQIKSNIVFISTPISVTIALFITFLFTIGRGHDNPWNGEIFDPKFANEIKLEHDLDSLNKIISSNPADKNQYLVRARMCFKSGGYYQKDVIQNYKIAIHYNDTCIPALEELFNIYFMTGDFSSARQTCYKILEISPDHEKGLYWKKILNRKAPAK